MRQSEREREINNLSDYSILLNRREERNSDYSSQDPSPMSSHFSRRERDIPPRHYHSSLDESDEENMDYNVMDRVSHKRREGGGGCRKGGMSSCPVALLTSTVVFTQ